MRNILTLTFYVAMDIISVIIVMEKGFLMVRPFGTAYIFKDDWFEANSWSKYNRTGKSELIRR